MKAGDRLGDKYRLVRQLGAGTMGVVWEAMHETTQRRVAIKLLAQPSEDLRHRLLREARICGAIAHRNVIEVYDTGATHEGEPYLVMQLLSGETLAELLRRQRRLSQPLAAQIGRDIARALAAAHAVNVIHRDLKPANVFLHQEAGVDGLVVKVLDFGVAKNLAAKELLVTAVGGAVGSPAYMSPEAIRGALDLDARTDIWSLGVVLSEMLTGTRPFPGGGQELLIRILSGPIPRLSQTVRHINAELDDIVAMCLERDRAKRIASAAVVERLLQAHVGPDEGSRIPVGLLERAMAGSSPDLGSVAPAVPQLAPATAPVIRSAPPMPDSTMRLNGPAPAQTPMAAMQPWMAAGAAVDATAPLPPSSRQQPHVGKAGTLIIGLETSRPATGPRGTERMIDSRAVLAQAASRPLPAPSLPPTNSNTPVSPPAKRKVKRTPMLGIVVGAIVIMGLAISLIVVLTKRPVESRSQDAPAALRLSP
ncbi:serine/threonine-protein kinase [Polyangium sp. 6x1]|uniref:serine/threonine-protein kinase n=1 Tax=Polyangium sp. 6x1 TaxID=3042689 RepID=UPI0024823505|nr:serine/threonine-protein kinase [Polyangium sp. 6x1]MDI1442488.1 protein kinase [Polyangium sp. 6x1]